MFGPMGILPRIAPGCARGGAPPTRSGRVRGFSTMAANLDPTNIVELRPPRPDEGGRVWQLVGDCGVLERNTAYAYLLLCSHFAETCVVAERSGELIGVVCGYRPPTDPDAIFVWQVGVHPVARGLGIGVRMLDSLAERLIPRGVTSLTATVTPSNEPSRALFEGFARRRGLTCQPEAGFPESAFPGEGHEAEEGLRIGPLTSAAGSSASEEVSHGSRRTTRV